MLLGEIVALQEGALVGVEDPFAYVVAIKVEPRGVVDSIPLLLSSVGVTEIDRGGLGDEVRGHVGRLVLLVPATIWVPGGTSERSFGSGDAHVIATEMSGKSSIARFLFAWNRLICSHFTPKVAV
jgi:hypothetical protein